MSPQLSAMPSAVPSASRCRDSSSLFETETANGNNVSNLTTIIQAADEAYRSAHVRLDTVVRSNADLPSMCSPTGGPRFALRKRKVSVTAPCTREPKENQAASNASCSSFLDGLFATDESDHYVTSDEGDSCPSTPVPQRKKARLGRCSKSYASFAHLSGSTRVSTRLSTSSYLEKSCGLQAKKHMQHSNASSKTKSSVDSKVLADSLQAAKDLADAVFPHLPATVSNADSIQLATSTAKAALSTTHCISAAPSTAPSSADLSSQTVAEGQNVPAPANNPHVEPELKVKEEEKKEQTELTLSDLQSFQDQQATINKVEESFSSVESADSYGWFLPLDDEADHGVIDAYSSSLSESGNSSSNLLAFQAPVSAKAGCTDHEAEVEWAKAADTIDDVLGDFF